MEKLGCKTVADLLKVDGETLEEASSVIFLRQFPERDGRILPAETFEAYANGAAKDIEFLAGCNKDEMNFFVSSFGPEGWVAWAHGRMARLKARLTEEEKALVESFYNDDEWPLYDMKDRKVTVLDEFDIHPEKESEMHIVDWNRTSFLTKYYMA